MVIMRRSLTPCAQIDEDEHIPMAEVREGVWSKPLRPSVGDIKQLIEICESVIAAHKGPRQAALAGGADAQNLIEQQKIFKETLSNKKARRPFPSSSPPALVEPPAPSSSHEFTVPQRQRHPACQVSMLRAAIIPSPWQPPPPGNEWSK